MLSAKDLIELRDQQSVQLSFGPKEFKPSGSIDELNQIHQSLSDIEKAISHEKIKILGSMSQAVWHPQLQLAEITYRTGSQWATMGHTSNEKFYVFPEEALYLLEAGSLEITYNKVPMSIQRAYFVLLGSSESLSLEKYRVYSHLSSLGLKVVRHFSKNSFTKYEKQLEMHKVGLKHKKYASSDKRKRLPEECSKPKESIKKIRSDFEDFPLNKSDCDNAEDVLKKVQIFSPCLDSSNTDLNFDYDVYINSTKKQTFKKSCLQLPNYRIIVFSSSENPMPQLNEINSLTRKYKDEVPVIYAVVFPDHIAYYEMNAVVLPNAFD